jgi:hypothetical protein
VKGHEPRTGEGGDERVNSESANYQSSRGRRIRKRERERERVRVPVRSKYETRNDSHEAAKAENTQNVE